MTPRADSAGPPPALPRLQAARALLRARDWQNRPEFAALCDWWRQGARGVCALVGIGGAGKTAIADRFLQVLPGGVEPSHDVAKQTDLLEPARILVFSFYDAPNPDEFFAELATFLGHAPEAPDRPVSYQQTLEWLAAACSAITERQRRLLLVLDGLEKVQDDGARGGAFGQLLDGRLRDFVLRIADGYLPGVHVLITTRFHLFDPLAWRCSLYHEVAVERLDLGAAIALLRARGVHGTDNELRVIACEQGFHALTVDLIGGYIAQFCGGDASKLTHEPHVPDSAPAYDPRVAAVREQERKFARVAERYRDALATSDPAALALLQRVCLFRLGVRAQTLAEIFTGEGKETISGKALARLDLATLTAKLDWLTHMRLLESSKSTNHGQQANVYTVHPAVRDGFLRSLDADTARRSHEAAKQGLTASLGEHVEANPSDPATLDLLEEIVYHTLEAGHAQEAFDIYWHRIGAFGNLGWRLGAYERGERICRAFAAGQSPETAPLPQGLSEQWQVVFINGWAMYLSQLGRLTPAARCHERHNEIRMRQENWKNASIGNQNLAEVRMLAGRLAHALSAAEEALRLADRADDAGERRSSYAYRGHARALRGDCEHALADFRDALHWQHEYEGKSERPLYSQSGIRHTLLLARLGHNDEATRLIHSNLEIWARVHERDGCFCTLILADLACERGDVAAARNLLSQAHDWAVARDAKEPLCWAALVRARIAFAEATEHGDVASAQGAIDEGLRIARDCGFGIYHIDLLLLRAHLHLHRGDAASAETDIRTALFDGVHPPADSGLPELIAATDPCCGYAWAEGDGRHLLGQALLLCAAQKLGSADFVPARADDLPPDVRDLIARARTEFAAAIDLRKRIQDPNYKETQSLLRNHKRGLLTAYPLAPAKVDGDIAKEEKPMPTASANGHVFISYAHKDREWLERLLTMASPLIRSNAISVWHDMEIKAGQKWRTEIDNAMAQAKVALLLVSPNFLASDFIADEELHYFLNAAKTRGVEIIWLLLTYCLYDRTPLKDIQAAHDISKPLSSLSKPECDKILVQICKSIESAIRR